MKNTSLKKIIYLKGYKEGFYASQKMAWAMAEELLTAVNNTAVNNSNKELVMEFINKIKS